MKIAIQGHPTRGKEVIQILKSLGGLNSLGLSGTTSNRYYYINDDNSIMARFYNKNYKIYTLEEFEKEFPFKVGDKVKDSSDNEVGTILGFTDIDGELMYVVNFEKSGHANMPDEELKYYKEMKEERNITLTLDKAKEWYKKGGELKEVALQAYSEEELTKIELPKSWEEFCDNYMIDDNEAYFDNCCTVYSATRSYRDSIHNKNICPSQKSAKAHLAMIQLEQLRNCWWNGWEPEWNSCAKHVIKWEGDNLTVFSAHRVHAFLVFPTREMAEEFFECFRNLIEIAGDLI